MFVEVQEVVDQVAGVGGRSQQEYTALVAVVALPRSVDFAGAGFVLAEVSVEIGSGLVGVTLVGKDCVDASLGCIEHMVKIFQPLSCMDQLAEVVAGRNNHH